MKGESADISCEIVGGDLFLPGSAILSIAAITQGSKSLPWANLNRIGAAETETTINKFKAAGYGGMAAAAAGALLAGPVGILAAAGVGAALGGMKRTETFEIWTSDGRFAVIKAPVGTMKFARSWKDIASRLAQQPPLLP